VWEHSGVASTVGLHGSCRIAGVRGSCGLMVRELDL